MQNQTRHSETLQLRGTPKQLLLHSALKSGDAPKLQHAEFLPDAKLSQFIGKEGYRFRVRLNRDGSLKRLKLRLPQAVPPGTYAAQIKTDKGSLPLQIQVEEKKRLHISPVTLALSGHPGGTIHAQLLIVNLGNVPVDIPSRDVVGIYDDDGMEVAFASTYRVESDDPLVLLKHFIGKLREGHGGLTIIQVLEGAGELAPNAQVSVALEITLSDSVKPNHNYHCVWSLGPVEYAITISITKP